MMQTLDPAAPETKSAGGDVTEAFGEFMSAFDAFKDANDQRLAEMDSRLGADVLTTEKVDRISAALDEHKRSLDRLALKAARPPLGRDANELAAGNERKAAFDAYMRSGDERGFRSLSLKALNSATGAEGGYLVPQDAETDIGKRLAILSPIRALASVRQFSGGVLKKPFAISGPASGWAGESQARPQTTAPALAELQFPAMELYAMPAATSSLLEDAAVDIDQWLTGEIETGFAAQESAAFVVGDGVAQPKGFLSYPVVAESAWAWGSLGSVSTGAAGALPAADASDVLVDLVYSLKAGYRQNAAFVMNRRTQAAIRKLKDADGNYLWQPPAGVGQKAMLMGFAVAEAEDMPDIAVNSLSLAFGDFGRGYLVADRTGVRVLRDPYTAKPYVLFYVTKRVGGGVQDFDAIKLLKFGV